MKFLLIFMSFMLTACAGTYHSPVTATEKPGEYIVQVVDDHFISSSLDVAKQAAIDLAVEQCSKENKVFEKIYQLDKPFTITNRPESILHFRCIEEK